MTVNVPNIMITASLEEWRYVKSVTIPTLKKLTKATVFLPSQENFKTHLHRVGVADTSTFRWCDDKEETTEHILYRIPGFPY